MGKTAIYPRNWVVSLFYLYAIITSCKVSNKNMKWFTSKYHLKNPASWLAEVFSLFKLQNTNFPRHVDGVIWYPTIWSIFQDIFSQMKWQQFEIWSKRSIFWAILSQLGQNGNFPPKSGSVTFLHLWSYNFMQSFRKMSNDSPVITITRTLKSDWPRDFHP